MKNIARNGTLLAFVALMSAQANAQVTIEKLTVSEQVSSQADRHTYNSFNGDYGQGLFKRWVCGITKDLSFSVIFFYSSTRLYSTPDKPKYFYKDPNKSTTLANKNPWLKYLDPQSLFLDDIESLFEAKRFYRFAYFSRLGYPDPEAARHLREDFEDRSAAEAFYRVTFSSNSSIVKFLIMRVAYELHLGYQEAKAALSDPEGDIDLKRISKFLRMIKNTKSDLMRDQQEKDVRRSGEGKIAAINAIIEKYGDAYEEIANAIAAVQIDDKHFVFQLPERPSDGAQLIEDELSYLAREFDYPIDQIKTLDPNLRKLRAQDYLYVTLDDESASRKVPADWYYQELGGHLIVGGPVVAPRSMNISNGTSNTISKNNNTREEMEKEEKGKD